MQNNPILAPTSTTTVSFFRNLKKHVIFFFSKIPNKYKLRPNASFSKKLHLIFFLSIFNSLPFLFPDKMRKSGINRQGYEPTFTTINNMRWGKPSYMTSYENYKKESIKNGVLPIPLPKTRNFDIDDQDDWRIAEAVFKELFL